MSERQPRPGEHSDANQSGGQSRRTAVAVVLSAVITGGIAAVAVIEGNMALLAVVSAYWLALALAYFVRLGWTANRPREH